MKLESSHPGDLRLCHRISLGNPADTGVFEVAHDANMIKHAVFFDGELEDFIVR